MTASSLGWAERKRRRKLTSGVKPLVEEHDGML